MRQRNEAAWRPLTWRYLVCRKRVQRGAAARASRGLLVGQQSSVVTYIRLHRWRYLGASTRTVPCLLICVLSMGGSAQLNHGRRKLRLLEKREGQKGGGGARE